MNKTKCRPQQGIGREPMAVGFSSCGEAKDIAERSSRRVSLLGNHPAFHSPDDVFKKAADAVLVAQCARMVATTVNRLR